jgi:steroid delta-isomerase-like uncharacterized protein
MTAEQEALARRFLEETQNTKNLDVIDELVAPDFVGHSEVIRGIEALKAAIQSNLDSFPDLAVTIDHQISNDNEVVTRYSARGTQRGEFHGLEPTGKEVRFTVVSIHRIADGKIAEGWRVVDRLDILEQLGRVAVSI